MAEERKVIPIMSPTPVKSAHLYDYEHEGEMTKMSIDASTEGVIFDVECGPFKVNVAGTWKSIFQTALDIFAPKNEEKKDDSEKKDG